ncbi:Lrp/AsnC family transcriptional regulator [Streptomyces specialis]|uniref:Lrp/AsnC family transcriptional regulator n=1 Tax=Streptomyces specialis TaxID=498367 RepID=UPI00073EC156|nr:Lrp/AsnC family transcriptional regulator [Streptomyces specialis]
MDELDSALVALLQRNARHTNRDLARALGIAPSTCLERVRSLHARGVITGHHAEVSLPMLGRRVQALVAVRLRPPNRPVIESFQEFVTQLPETISVFVVSGAEDFLIHVAVRDTEHLHAFILDHLTQRREIADVRTSVVFQHMQKAVVEPLSPDPSDAR